MDYSKFQPVEDMSEVTHIFKKIFDGGKSYGTDTLRMGFFHDQVLTAKVEDKRVETIEVGLDSYTLKQSRGLQNKSTEYHERIVKLMEDNMQEIINRNEHKMKIAV